PTVHEAPLIARHDAAGRQPAVALGQHVVGMLAVGDRIRPVVTVAERQRGDAFVRRPVAANDALEVATTIGRDGRVQTQDAGAGWRSTMRALAGLVGSSANSTVPTSFS